jgi:hypothetical protein
MQLVSIVSNITLLGILLAGYCTLYTIVYPVSLTIPLKVKLPPDRSKPAAKIINSVNISGDPCLPMPSANGQASLHVYIPLDETSVSLPL